MINFQLSIIKDNVTEVLGYFEEGEVINISTEITNTQKVFHGWSDISATYYESTGGNKTTISYPLNTGLFDNKNNLTTSYTMPQGDIILNPIFVKKPEIMINHSI